MTAWLAGRDRIEASTRWLPACSFLEDTAGVLRDIAGARAGLYHVDANEGWSFYDIACALRARHGAEWDIRATHEPLYDQRLVDRRTRITQLSQRLPELLQRRVLLP